METNAAIAMDPTRSVVFKGASEKSGLPVSQRVTESTAPIPADTGSAANTESKDSDDWSDIFKACGICGDETSSMEFLRMACGELYCDDCIIRLFKAAVNDESLFPPKCCKEAIPFGKVHHLFTREFQALFHDREMEFGAHVRIYCHKRTCSQFIGHCVSEARKVVCPHCGSETCMDCKAAAHDGACPEDPAMISLMETAAQEGYRQCFKCMRLIERKSGCNHMMFVVGAICLPFITSL